MEVPPQLIYLSIYWKNKYFNIGVFYNYVEKVWNDDQNTLSTPHYYQVDFKILKTFKKSFIAAVGINDIFNQKHIDSKGYLSPGRFAILSLIYKY